MICTFSSHACLETLLEAAVLALVAVVLVDRTATVSAASVREVTADRALEEALAALTRELSVMLPRTLVSANHALNARLFGLVSRHC